MTRLKGLAALAALCCAVAAQAATVRPAQPMSFSLIRAGKFGCSPDCPEWIAAEGEIKPGSARQFEAFLARLDGRRIPVIVNSNGGSVEDALRIGRMIRARGLAVAVGRTEIAEPHAPFDLAAPSDQPLQRGDAYSYPALCLSACSLILAGGVERYASPLAVIGVHEVKQRQSRTYVLRRFLVRYRMVNGRKTEISREIVSEDRNTVVSTEIDPASVDARILAYFKEMGEQPRLLDLMRTATPDRIHVLTVDEEKNVGLVTLWIDQSFAMMTDLRDNGLAGTPVDPTSRSRAAIEAGQSWRLGGAAGQDGPELAVHFAMRRGGGGVAASATLRGATWAAVRFGFAPASDYVRRLSPSAPDAIETFLPIEAFCRCERWGEVFAVRTSAAPTHAPGLPDPSASLLRVAFASVQGVAALAAEICAAGKPHGS